MITPGMVHDAAYAMAWLLQSRTPLTAEESECGRPAPDPAGLIPGRCATWLELAEVALQAAVVAEREEQGPVYRADVAALEARVRELEAQLAEKPRGPYRVTVHGEGAA